MAGRFFNPYPQFSNSTPALYSGGSLTFYASGTSTPLATYSDEGLSVANTNPVVLNSAGRPTVDIFLQDALYKVVLKDASGNVIWTADPYSSRDSSLVVKTLTGSGSPNGAVAGTAGSASILPDFYWDYTNAILYVCTTTGSGSTAVWTAINASSAIPAVPPPQGRLTLTSGTPVLSSGVSSATSVYYTPYVGNLIPIYNGSSLIPTTFAELTLSLTSSHAANTIYDVFVFSNSGVLTLVTGPAWTTSTAGSGARGTGASTTQLTRVGGLYVNAVQMTARNGSTTYTVGANLATYVGSLFIDGSAGQATCHIAYGQSRKWAVWNAYNRKPVILRAGDSTATWSYTTNTIRAANGSSSNSLTIFAGLPEEVFDLTYIASVSASLGEAGNLAARSYIGYNSTSAGSGLAGVVLAGNPTGAGTNITVGGNPTAEHIAPPAIGINTITALENGGGSSGATWSGTDASMRLTAKWNA